MECTFDFGSCLCYTVRERVIPLTNKQFVDQLKKAVNSKTLYIMGCFGAPMNTWNIKKTSSVGRTWVSHGKLKAVEYIKDEPKPAPVKCDVFCVFPENATDAEINSTRVEMERIGVCPVILTKRG